MAMLLARSDVFKLNVGGVIYSTTRSTLAKHSHSTLAGIASNRVATIQDDQGHAFIDRNGKQFEYVLRYLRTGKLTLPEDFVQYNILLEDAEYYKLPSLVAALQQYRENQRVSSNIPSQAVLICWLLGHDKKSNSVCHYQIYCKYEYESFKRQADYTLGGKLTLQTFHNYLETKDEWKIVKSETMTESNAAAFFLSMGFEESPFRKELTYTNVKVELWKKVQL